MLWVPTLNPERRKILPTHGTPSSSISHARPDIALICKNHQKIYNQKEKEEKKRSKPNGNLCSHILESLKRINDPMKIRRPQKFERLEKILQHGGVIGGNSEGGQEDRHIMLQFFLLPLRLRRWRGGSRRHSQNFFCNPNSPKLPTVCTQVDHRRCSGTPSSFTPS